MLENLIDEIQRLQLAYELLEKVYLERGSYSQYSISNETWQKVNRFFEFDDSE